MDLGTLMSLTYAEVQRPRHGLFGVSRDAAASWMRRRRRQVT